MVNVKEYDVEKLNKVKEEITKENDKLVNQIALALGNNDMASYEHLKQLQLQCTAQLRFIELLENDFEDDKYIIC